jgi:hypothetical protein
MFVKIDGVVINKKYIGYAYVVKRDGMWILHVRCMNENQHADYLELKYKTKKEAEEVLQQLCDQLD